MPNRKRNSDTSRSDDLISPLPAAPISRDTEHDHDEWPDDLLDGYRPTAHWHDLPATERQRDCLRNRGYQPPRFLTRGEAAFALSKPTPKQRALLERHDRWEKGLTFDEASKAIKELAEDKGWRR